MWMWSWRVGCHICTDFTWSYGETAKECRLYATTSCSRRSQATVVRISSWAGNTRVRTVHIGLLSVLCVTRIPLCVLLCAEQPPSTSPAVRREKMPGSPGGVPRLRSKYTDCEVGERNIPGWRHPQPGIWRHSDIATTGKQGDNSPPPYTRSHNLMVPASVLFGFLLEPTHSKSAIAHLIVQMFILAIGNIFHCRGWDVKIVKLGFECKSFEAYWVNISLFISPEIYRVKRVSASVLCCDCDCYLQI